MVTLCLCLLTAGNCLGYANNHEGGNHSPRTHQSSVADNHRTAGSHQDHSLDGESHLHSAMPTMQGFSPLHVPQFTSSMGYHSPGMAAGAGASTCPLTGNQSKVRGASDCPGVCPLCGATLRQARNLRRHLLSSCKYRFSNNTASQSAGGDSPMMMSIKPEVEVAGYNDQGTRGSVDSGGSNNSFEHIVCKPSLLSPTTTTTDGTREALSPHRSIPSPTIAR